MHRVEPEKYFGDFHLAESLLLRFLYQPSRQTLEVVFDYAAETVSKTLEQYRHGVDRESVSVPPRDLRHLQFTSVTAIRGPTGIERDVEWREYERRLLAKPVVILDASCEFCEQRYELQFVVQHFGRHIIEFGDMREERRLLAGRAIGVNKWEYHDIRTGTSVDFYNPFPGIDRTR